jgi:hypothetical protein
MLYHVPHAGGFANI